MLRRNLLEEEGEALQEAEVAEGEEEEEREEWGEREGVESLWAQFWAFVLGY